MIYIFDNSASSLILSIRQSIYSNNKQHTTYLNPTAHECSNSDESKILLHCFLKYFHNHIHTDVEEFILQMKIKAVNMQSFKEIKKGRSTQKQFTTSCEESQRLIL